MLDLSEQRGLKPKHLKQILTSAPGLQTLFLGEDEASLDRDETLALLMSNNARCRIDHPILYQFHFECRSGQSCYPKTVISQLVVSAINGDMIEYRTGSMNGDYMTIYDWGQLTRRLQRDFRSRAAETLCGSLAAITHRVAVQVRVTTTALFTLMTYTGR